jgi:hypothetical protein
MCADGEYAIEAGSQRGALAAVGGMAEQFQRAVRAAEFIREAIGDVRGGS